MVLEDIFKWYENLKNQTITASHYDLGYSQVAGGGLPYQTKETTKQRRRGAKATTFKPGGRMIGRNAYSNDPLV